jgi:hypothetical protein
MVPLIDLGLLHKCNEMCEDMYTLVVKRKRTADTWGLTDQVPCTYVCIYQFINVTDVFRLSVAVLLTLLSLPLYPGLLQLNLHTEAEAPLNNI